MCSNQKIVMQRIIKVFDVKLEIKIQTLYEIKLYCILIWVASYVYMGCIMLHGNVI
jgi:hypothetical protein